MKFSLYPPENVTGASDQTFHVGDPTSQSHAVPADWVSYFPTVASSATLDVFGAAGASLDVSGTTTVTKISACDDAQVGSKKTIIPSDAAGFSITAGTVTGTTIVVDGAASGTFLMPKDAIVEVFAKSTTLVVVTTIFATGTWTPNQGAGLTVVGAFSSSGWWVKQNNIYTYTGQVTGAISVALAAGGQICSNFPVPASVPVSDRILGSASNITPAQTTLTYYSGGGQSITGISALSASGNIFFSGQWRV